MHLMMRIGGCLPKGSTHHRYMPSSTLTAGWIVSALFTIWAKMLCISHWASL